MAKQINSSGEVIKEMCFARNDMRILAIVRDCGFVTAKQVHDIMVYRGFKETHMKHVYGYLKRLANMGHVEFHRRVLPNNTGVLSVTNSGHAMLQMWGYGLGINADPHSSPAGVDHFLALNEAMLKFHRNYKVSFWLTDFGVQAENEVRREDGFAKDYDAVTEITFDNSPLTLALEYEHTLRNRTRYREAFESYTKDPYVQLVVVIVDSDGWIGPVAEAVRVPGRRVCFATRAQFLAHPFTSLPVRRWNGQEVEVVNFTRALQEASGNKNTRYLVSFAPPK